MIQYPFENYNNTLCIHGGWLYKEGEIISFSTYKNYVNRGKINVLRRGCRETPALIEWNSMPDKIKKPVIRMKGNPENVNERDHLSSYIERDLVAEEFFRDHTKDDGSRLSEPNRLKYTADAEIFNAIERMIAYRQSISRKNPKTVSKNVWDQMVDILPQLPDDLYPHSFKKIDKTTGDYTGMNLRVLRRRYNAYKKEGYTSLIHGNEGNNHSEKLTEAAKRWVLARWSDRVMKVATINQLWVEYNQKAASEGWKELKDDRSLYMFLNNEEIRPLWHGHRHGEKKAKEKYSFQFSTKMPTMRDSLWYSDGTKLNYYYLTEDGKVATCQVYEVMDAFSEVLLGYHISLTEDYEAQYMAYKMAAKASGHRPYQLGFDNQGGHKKLVHEDNFLHKLGRLAIKAQPYNGKSKTIELAFKRFQEHFLKKDWFFTGQNVQSKTEESKANMEFILANKENLKTLEEIKEIYKQRREEWNNAPHHATKIPRLDMYRNSENPEAPEIGIFEMVDLFWIMRPLPVTFTPYGITFKEKKREYTYMAYDADNMPDMEFLQKNIDKKFHIKFDPEDMSMIYLYEKDSLGLRFVRAVTTKVEVFRGKQEQEEWEAAYIHQVLDNNKKARIERRDKMDAILEEHGMLPEQYGLNSPPLAGLESKRKKATKGKVKKVVAKDYDKVMSNVDEMDGPENYYKNY